MFIVFLEKIHQRLSLYNSLKLNKIWGLNIFLVVLFNVLIEFSLFYLVHNKGQLRAHRPTHSHKMLISKSFLSKKTGRLCQIFTYSQSPILSNMSAAVERKDSL